MTKIKKSLNTFHKSIFKSDNLHLDHRKKVISLAIFYILSFTVLITLIGQMPAFTSRGITKFFQIGWILALIPIIMLDYRHALRSLLNCIIIVFPFIVYCTAAYFCGVKSFEYSGTSSIFLAAYIFFIAVFFEKYFSINVFRGLAKAFVLGAAVYALIVYINRLRGYDISNPIYAFNDKNSAGPIFMTAALLAFYIFNKKNFLHYLLKILIFCYFTAIVVLAKCRATIVFVPIIMIALHFALPSTKKKKIISGSVFTGFLILCVAIVCIVPFLREKIIFNILLNGKKTISEAFSGRIEQIINAFKAFKPVIGDGNHYIDCMPLSFLLTYGIIGLITLIPFAIIPFYAIIKNKKNVDNKIFNIVSLLVLFMLLFNSIFEGLGYFGPGSKVFFLWLVAGYSFGAILNYSAKSIYQPIDRMSKVTLKIKPKPFLIALQIILIGGSCGFVAYKSLSSNLGETVAKLLPAANKTAPFTNLSKIDIADNPTSNPNKPGYNNLCVGQKIKFTSTYNPITADDYATDWTTGWLLPNAISVNNYTGVVEAKKNTGKTVTILCAYYVPYGSYSKYRQLFIGDPDTYKFDSTYIDIEPFKNSFELSEMVKNNKVIEIQKGYTSKVFYDTNYLVNKNYFEFFSSDDTKITIDNTGIVKAEGNPGDTVEIYGKIKDGQKREYETVNKIKFKIVEPSKKPFKDVTSIEMPESIELYQYQPFQIKPTFNKGEGASDEAIDIEVINDSNLDYDLENDYITFKTFGKAKLNIKSRSNPKQQVTVDLNIKANAPKKFTCSTEWLVVGDRKDAKDLGLYLEFENGYKKVVTEDDLQIDKIRTNRASSKSSGFIDGKMTKIGAFTTGKFSYKYICKYNKEVTYTLNLQVNVLPKAIYQEECANIGLIIIFVVISIVSVFMLFVDFKKKITLILVSILYIGLVTLTTFLVYGISVCSVSCLIAFTCAIYIVDLFRIAMFKNNAIQFIDKK